MGTPTNLGALEARLKSFYELRASEEPPRDPEAQIRFRKAIRMASLREGDRVLDLGAKTGGLAGVIRSLCIQADYTGFDLSDSNVAAGSASGLHFVQGDVTEPLPFPDASFECVIALELLEHVTVPVSLLAEMRRVLTAAGRAVVSVPSPYSWVEVARELFRRDDSEGHLNAFTTPVMTNVAALAGFRIDGRWGTSFRVPRTGFIVPTNSILARSRIYRLTPASEVVFARRPMHWPEQHDSSQ